MIPYIRSLTELMAITEPKVSQNDLSIDDKIYRYKVESGQEQRYLKSSEKKELDLPHFSKILERKLMQNKKSVSKFLDDLDYNNQIQSSYDLTLLERQNKRNQQDVA